MKIGRKTQERSHWLLLFFICITSTFTLAELISIATVRADPNEQEIGNRYVALDQSAQCNSSRLLHHRNSTRICRCGSLPVGHTQHNEGLHRHTAYEGRGGVLHRSRTEPYSSQLAELQGEESTTSARRSHRSNNISSVGVAAEDRSEGGNQREPDRGVRGKRATSKIKEINSDLHRLHQSTPNQEVRRKGAVNKSGGIGTVDRRHSNSAYKHPNQHSNRSRRDRRASRRKSHRSPCFTPRLQKAQSEKEATTCKHRTVLRRKPKQGRRNGTNKATLHAQLEW